MNLKKIQHVLLTKKQNFYYIRLNIGSTKNFYWSKQNELSQKYHHYPLDKPKFNKINYKSNLRN